ncbi:alternative oxidase 1B [Striga asiatica]|uniref:Alternative oxidase 1B n=1 Tax=Striga asiatica TaxID=4170 RepID=A0A5A7R9E4_STRAF|nr:alternative oxidase 1B [Striga asiatica]
MIAVQDTKFLSGSESKIALAFLKSPHLAYMLINELFKYGLNANPRFIIVFSTSIPIFRAPRLAQDDRTPTSVTSSGHKPNNFISSYKSKTSLQSPFCEYPDIIAFQEIKFFTSISSNSFLASSVQLPHQTQAMKGHSQRQVHWGTAPGNQSQNRDGIKRHVFGPHKAEKKQPQTAVGSGISSNALRALSGEENLQYMDIRAVCTKGSRRQPDLMTAAEDLRVKGKVKAFGATPERSIWRAWLYWPLLERSLSCVFHFPAAAAAMAAVVMRSGNLSRLMDDGTHPTWSTEVSHTSNHNKPSKKWITKPSKIPREKGVSQSFSCFKPRARVIPQKSLQEIN